jgi:hypothetical protein
MNQGDVPRKKRINSQGHLCKALIYNKNFDRLKKGAFLARLSGGTFDYLVGKLPTICQI